MTIIATFLGNAGLNFVVGLLVARFLGPGEFGRYAIAMAAAIVVHTILFEWLRLAATRFYSDRTRTGEPAIRATLEFGFGALILALAVLVGLGLLVGVEAGGLSPALLAVAAGAGLSLGLFEYHAALARARFAEQIYARLILAKNVLSLGLMVGVAAWSGDATLVVAGSALASIGAVLVVRRTLADTEVAGFAHVEPRRARSFLSYALPLVAASALYQLIPFANRTWLAGHDGFAEAGYFSLAVDLGLRLFGTVGSALDILLFQVAVRADEVSGRARAENQIARNAAFVAAVLLPAAAGFWAVLPALEALIVPAAYRGPFGAYSALLIPAFLAIGLVQYALNPIFQLRKRTAPVIAAALAGLLVNAALLVPVCDRLGPHGAALAQAAGLVAALAVLGVLALTGPSRIRLPWRDLILSVLATGLMSAALAPLRGLDPPFLSLIASAGLGVLIYGSLAWLFDIAGLGTLARAKLRRAPTPAAAE